MGERSLLQKLLRQFQVWRLLWRLQRRFRRQLLRNQCSPRHASVHKVSVSILRDMGHRGSTRAVDAVGVARGQRHGLRLTLVCQKSSTGRCKRPGHSPLHRSGSLHPSEHAQVRLRGRHASYVPLRVLPGVPMRRGDEWHRLVINGHGAAAWHLLRRLRSGPRPTTIDPRGPLKDGRLRRLPFVRVVGRLRAFGFCCEVPDGHEVIVSYSIVDE
mmetsp:Transcript_76858/g.213522  ORF Transcript_76858/g.213522 Transcript_76858/m.213522 type:complete len:214 (+) Transcript_76858:163-804(+)